MTLNISSSHEPLPKARVQSKHIFQKVRKIQCGQCGLIWVHVVAGLSSHVAGRGLVHSEGFAVDSEGQTAGGLEPWDLKVLGFVSEFDLGMKNEGLGIIGNSMHLWKICSHGTSWEAFGSLTESRSSSLEVGSWTRFWQNLWIGQVEWSRYSGKSISSAFIFASKPFQFQSFFPSSSASVRVASLAGDGKDW